MIKEIAPQEFYNFMALPDHIQVDVLARCNSVKTMLNLSESCSHLHHLMLSTPRLMNQLKLVLRFSRSTNDVVHKLSTVLSNASIGRKYERMKLLYSNEALNSYVKPLMLKILKIAGKSVKELEVNSGTFDVQDLISLLRSFENVEKLTLSNVQLNLTSVIDDLQDFLPKLNKLTLQDSNSSLLTMFEGFTTLSLFKFHLNTKGSDVLCYGIENFRKFLLQQRKLKTLEIARMHKHCFTLDEGHRSMDFQLESLIANRFFVQRESAAHFFRHQAELKTIKLYDFYDSRIFPNRVDYSNVLTTIFRLTKLESVGIFNNSINLEDFEVLGEIRNASVKHLEYDMWNATAFDKFTIIFPNLEKISFRSFTVKLKDVPHNKLAIMNTTGGYNLEEFSYQPQNIEVDEETFERMLRDFILRHKTIKHLTVGSSGWLNIDFGLSLNFWIEILYHLPDLCDLVVHNPLHIRTLVMLLARNKNAFKSVSLYTSFAGKELTKGLEQPWLKVFAVCVVKPLTKIA